MTSYKLLTPAMRSKMRRIVTIGNRMLPREQTEQCLLNSWREDVGENPTEYQTAMLAELKAYIEELYGETV